MKNAWALVTSHGQLIGLFLIGMIFLFLVESSKNKILFSYCLLALLFLWSPFTANDLIAFYIPALEYWYAFMLLPVTAVCGYCFVEAVNMQEKGKKRWIVFLALLFICYLAGVGLGSRGDLQRSTNRAYLNEEYLELFAKMDVEGEPVVMLANDIVLENARAYSSYLSMPYEPTLISQSKDVAIQFYSEDMITLYERVQDPAGHLASIVRGARKYQCNYVILPIEADDREAMENMDYRVLFESDNWVLYHDEKLWKE